MKVELLPKAQKYLDRINEPYRQNIINALDGLEQEPPKGDIKPLTGHGKGFRLRIGSIEYYSGRKIL